MPAKILIADDDPSLRLLVSTTLADADLTLIEAQDGLQALGLARSERPNLILLDVAMPGLTGLEVARSLRQEAATSLIPIVMLSAKTRDCDRALGLESGARAYLTKPFSPLQLIALVESILADGLPSGNGHRPAWA